MLTLQYNTYIEDRFTHKKTLAAIFGCLTLICIFEIKYNWYAMHEDVVLIDDSSEHKTVNLWKGIVSIIHSSVTMILTAISFMKLDVRTIKIY